MTNTLILAPTPLRPTTSQVLSLELLYDTAEQIHLAVRTWLRAVGAGLHMHVREALWQTADGHLLPRVDDHRLIDIRLDALHQLAQVTHRDLPPRWQAAVPPTVLARLLDIEAQRLQRFGNDVKAGTALPLWPLDRVALDSAAQPIDEYRVMIEGLPDPVVADLWALPTDLTCALLAEADAHAAAVNAEWNAQMERLLRGDASAAATLYGLGRDAWPWLGRTVRHTVDRTVPHRYQHVSLVRTTDESGARSLILKWTIRIPRTYLPQARDRSAYGIDIGYRNIATGASVLEITSVPRQVDVRAGLPEPQDTELLTHAVMRQQCLEPHRTGLEAVLWQALQHQHVHAEAINWQGIRERGAAPWSAAAMALVGAPLLIRWIAMLAPMTGTCLHLIDPAHTSVTCSRCGAVGERPWPYTQFHCPTCDTWTDADHNSAAVLQGGRVTGALTRR
ncbi:zinc ribbon domain-containing protein [Deinococcus marmoris]|uniref:Cas12f1-like TNB domain-containing protein n=1 Tax=Deinococcus marmoris TaxID=249408 RepID=A0A1U7P228_9DEIO|nr:zinc ribbon domain-containing protein [Deinococcus marmoris]OLV19221.1 hypothetical protein BOO71_0003454 [Deinococcus marmoris]